MQPAPDVRRERDILRFVACGSVDDGKSTLIGRLLFESGNVPGDEMARVRADSRRHGTCGGDVDLALLVDGLRAEREQGITIDVAYRSFSTPRRSFIVADAPGHEQYTRNMATGASTADAALVLVDAERGVVSQTRRHSAILSLMGVPRVILAVNKMDRVAWSEDAFRRIDGAYRKFAADLGFAGVESIPVSALTGANVAARSEETSWYAGETILGALEAADVPGGCDAQPFRMPVQWVNRRDSAFRGFAGTIASGRVSPGDAVLVCPGSREATVARIVTRGGDLESARAGQAVTLTFAEDVDASRGDVIASASHPPGRSDQFACNVIWMDESELLPKRQYLLKIGTCATGAQVTALKHRLSIDTLERAAARTLGLNDVGCCNIILDRNVAFDPYREIRKTGGFILIDRFTRATVGAGTIDFALRRASNLTKHALAVDRSTRAAQKDQAARVLWFTGLSGSGKSTTVNEVERRLLAMGRHSYVLDGDNLRHGLTKDLGFTEADRAENLRRVAEVAKLLADAGLIVLVSVISPFRADRLMARELMEDGEFIEVFVDAPLEVCEERDPKGLYRKARAGEIANFTGIDSPYEAPESPDLVLDSANCAPEELADQVVGHLLSREASGA